MVTKITTLHLFSVHGAARKLTSLSLCCLWLQSAAMVAECRAQNDDEPKLATSSALLQVSQQLVPDKFAVQAESDKNVEHHDFESAGLESFLELEEVQDEEIEDVDLATSEANPENPSKLLAWQRQGCNSGRDSLSSKETLLHKPAYIFSARQEAAGWIHLPMHATLVEALTSLGFQVQLRFVEDGCDVQKSVEKFLSRGITPLIVSTSSHRIMQQRDAPCPYGNIVRQLASKGAYLVLYNSEPSRDAQKIVDHTLGWGAREVWQYSQSIMDNFIEHHASQLEGVKVRYMPAGCADALNFGVQSNATDRDESHLAGLFHWKARPKSKQDEFGSQFGDALHQLGPNEIICHAQGYRDFFAKYPVQLNVHSEWNHDPAAMESVRAALLLTNKVCLLSTNVDVSDGMLWQRSVKFGNPSYLRETFETLRGDSEAIAQCQEEQHKNFCEQFKPSTLIEKAGFKGTEAHFSLPMPKTRVERSDGNKAGVLLRKAARAA